MSSPDPFTPLPLFAFPFFSTIVGAHATHKEPLIREILDVKRKHPVQRRSPKNVWRSGDELLTSRSEHVAFVLHNATNFARAALARYYQDWSSVELRLGTWRANVLGAGGWNAPHHHHPAHWSGSYFVSMPQVGGADDLGGMIEFLNPTPWNTLGGTAGNFAYGPKEGLLLLFPASLVHFVHPHGSEEPRISIDFDFNVGPKRAS